MYWTMLRRELSGRKRQTIIVAAGLAIAIALVIAVSALSAGVREAQSQALEGVYGVGTDLTVTGAPQEPGQNGGPRFEFGGSEGSSADGTTTLSQSRLTTGPGRGTIDASAVDTVAGLDGVASATGVLSLTNMTFSGEVPDPTQMSGGAPGEGGGPAGGMGGADGRGGSAFGIDSFTVLGIDPAAGDVGPLTATELVSGRALTAADQGELVALVDESYAATAELALGDTIEVGGSEVEIVGVLASATDSADTAANVYLPIDTASELAGVDGQVSTVYVSATSAAAIDGVQSEIEAALPDTTVSSQAQLAEQVSGSLTSAASLISNLGTWLSIIVLAVALLIAMLLTSSGVSRRTREFGTLKAIGWKNRRVVAQVAGESMAQALIGGAAGLVLGLGAVWVINLISPTIGGSAASGFDGAAGQGGQGGMPGGMNAGEGGFPGGGMGGGGFGQRFASASEIVLHAPVTLWIVVAAVGLAVLGGLLAGAFGGWRAARLSPVEALRAVA